MRYLFGSNLSKLSLLILIMLAACSFACAEDLSGQWDMVANTNYHFILDLQQSGNQITGTMTSKDDATLPVETISGTMSGGTIQFTRELAGQQTQVYIGSVSGSTIIGSFTQNGQGQYPWSASKQGSGHELKVTNPTELVIGRLEQPITQAEMGTDEPVSVSESVALELDQVQIQKEGLPLLISINGQKQGLITNDCSDLSGNEDQCIVYAFNLEMGMSQGNGQLAGRLNHGPLIITKPINRVSASLIEAMSNDEVLDVVLRLFRVIKSGEPENYCTVNLKKAKITAIKQYKLNKPDLSGEVYADLEDVTFAYERIEFTSEDRSAIYGQ